MEITEIEKAKAHIIVEISEYIPTSTAGRFVITNRVMFDTIKIYLTL